MHGSTQTSRSKKRELFHTGNASIVNEKVDATTCFSWAFLLSLKLWIGGRPLPRFLMTAGGRLQPVDCGAHLESWSADSKLWKLQPEVSWRLAASDKQSGEVTSVADSMLHNTGNGSLSFTETNFSLRQKSDILVSD